MCNLCCEKLSAFPALSPRQGRQNLTSLKERAFFLKFALKLKNFEIRKELQLKNLSIKQIFLDMSYGPSDAP